MKKKISKEMNITKEAKKGEELLLKRIQFCFKEGEKNFKKFKGYIWKDNNEPLIKRRIYFTKGRTIDLKRIKKKDRSRKDLRINFQRGLRGYNPKVKQINLRKR